MSKKGVGKHSKSAVEARNLEKAQEPKVGFIPAEPPMATSPKRPRHAWRVALVCLGVLACAYAGVALFFSFFFMPSTTLNGTDVSLKLGSTVASTLVKDTSSYSARVSGDGIDLTIKASDVDLAFDADSYMRDALSQVNAWAWPYELTRSHQIDLEEDATYDANKLRSLVSADVATINATATRPQDATVSYDEASSSFKVAAEVLGTAIDEDRLLQTMGEGLSSLDTTIDLGEESLLLPSRTQDDPALATAASSADKLLKTSITLTMDGMTAATIDSAQIQAWVSFSDDLTPSIDVDKVSAWTEGDLSNRLDTVGSTRTYTRPDGKVITVSGGSYGWSIDGSSLADQITSDLTAGTSETIDIPTLKTASVIPTTAGEKDWGARYIDVDISEQHVRMYDDSGTLVWETDCVTGTSSLSRDTPQGVYYIVNKQRNATLLGETDPTTSQPTYTSQVSYWMPFVGNLVGLHDASWRSSFGGTIYKSNGSHGCVNLPTSAAAELWDLAQIGDVVVTHE